MASIISAGTTSGTSLNLSGDTSGVLQLATNGSTTAVTITTAQNVGIGTSSPGSKLSLGTSSVATAGYPTIRTFETGSTTMGIGTSSSSLDICSNDSGYRITFYTGSQTPTERMRIDSSGNVGIGTTSPAATLDVGSSIARSGAAQNNIYADYRITAATTGVVSSLASRIVGIGGSTYTIPDVAVYKADPTVAQTGVTITNAYGLYIGNMADPTSGGTVTNSWGVYQTSSSNKNYFAGNVLVGTSSNSGWNGKLSIESNSDTSYYPIAINNTASGTGSFVIQDFYRNGTRTGTITATGSATAYNTSSDYRLKENIAPMVGALATIQALKPVTFNWKIDGSNGQGFIAHELQAVVPDCVSGEKDAVDADGNIKPQGVDTSFLVATLTAAIQELKAELDATKAEVAALKGVN